MKNTFLFIGILVVLAIVGGFFISFARDEAKQNVAIIPNDIQIDADSHVYFWSVTCPHCKNVQEFIDGWEGKDKFKVTKYEVNESKENANLFLKTGTDFCNLPKNQLGVPLLITPQGECLAGDVPIIEYLKSLEL